VTGLLVLMVVTILAESIWEWSRVLSGRKVGSCKEAPYVPTQFATEEA
jgi:hypothetical protein